jgi:hypothetical protein
MDAWTLAMKEEDASSVLEEKSEGDESMLTRVLSRIEQIESRAKQSNEEIKGLHQRLLEAEIKFGTNQKTKVPWRRIGVNSRTIETVEAADLSEEEISAEEEFEPPNDIYTVIATWKFNSKPFWISINVVAIQILLLTLLLIDQIDSGAEKSLQIFPANVPTTVHVSQALAIIVAIMGQDDLRIAIEGYFDGLPTRFKGDIAFQEMNSAQWNLSYGARFVQGLLSVIASFILALQSESVFDVLLNFLGVKFVSELDDLAFLLSELGYLGVQTQRAAKHIAEVNFQQDNRNNVVGRRGSRSWLTKYAHVIGVFTVLFTLIGLFIYIVITQNAGDFSVQEVRLDFFDETIPFLGIFDGCYRASQTGKTSERRLVYEQVGFEQDGGKFGYCSNIDGEQGWTFFIGDSSDPCDGFLARSEATATFDLLEAGDTQWYSNEGVPLDSQLSRVCAVASTDPLDDVCEELDLSGIIDATQAGARSMSFRKTFVNATESNVFTIAPLSHPIYVGDMSTPQKYDLVVFTGGRWVLTQLIEPNATLNSNAASISEYLDTDDSFRLIVETIVKEGRWVELVSESVNSDNGQVTPLGLQWYRPRKEQTELPFNVAMADLSRPVDVVFSCARCDNTSNPCYHGGTCTPDSTCECENGGSGTLCQETPVGDGECNPYFNTDIYDYDGGDCCGGTCVGPACGLAGLESPFGLDPNSDTIIAFDPVNFGYEFCKDPNMASLTIELDNFDTFNDPLWNDIAGNDGEDPWCNAASLNVRCDGKTYLHVPQHILRNTSDCSRSFAETIKVPFGASCELTTNAACFGPFCLDHNVSVYYGNATTSNPIQSGSISTEPQLSFGVPSKCLTDVLLNLSASIFDMSAPQGMAASVLSNDGLSEYLCNEDPDLVVERYALAVFNASVLLESSNSEAHQCRGWGIPAVQTTCANNRITSLILGIGATTKQGSIPTELALLSDLGEYGTCVLFCMLKLLIYFVLTSLLIAKEQLTLRLNNLTGTIPTELGTLSNLGKRQNINIISPDTLTLT